MSEMDTSFFNLYLEIQLTTDIWDIRDFNHVPCSLLRKTNALIRCSGLMGWRFATPFYIGNEYWESADKRPKGAMSY